MTEEAEEEETVVAAVPPAAEIDLKIKAAVMKREEEATLTLERNEKDPDQRVGKKTRRLKEETKTMLLNHQLTKPLKEAKIGLSLLITQILNPVTPLKTAGLKVVMRLIIS